MAGPPGQGHATGPPGRWDTEATGLQTQQSESQGSRGSRVTKRDSAAFESTRNAETPRLPRVVEKRALEAPNRVKSARVRPLCTLVHSAPGGPRGAVGRAVSSVPFFLPQSPSTQGTPTALPGRPRPAGVAVGCGRLRTRTRHSYSPWGHRCHLSAGRRLRRSQAARAPAAVYPP